MANVPMPGEDYVTFAIDITTINENEEKSKDIINSSQSKSEDLINDAIGSGNSLPGFD